MTKWSEDAKTGLVTFDEGLFTIDLNAGQSESPLLYEWTKQIAEYRLQNHFKKSESNINEKSKIN